MRIGWLENRAATLFDYAYPRQTVLGFVAQPRKDYAPQLVRDFKDRKGIWTLRQEDLDNLAVVKGWSFGLFKYKKANGEGEGDKDEDEDEEEMGRSPQKAGTKRMRSMRN